MANSPDEELIRELLLDREVSVGAIAPEDPVEEDLVAVVDLHVRIRWRGVPEHRPGEGLKSHVTQGTSGLVVPATTRRTSLRVDRDRDRCLDPVQRVVREQRQVVPRVGGHHLITFRQNVDGA